MLYRIKWPKIQNNNNINSKKFPGEKKIILET